MNIDTTALNTAHKRIHFLHHTKPVMQQLVDRAAAIGMTFDSVSVVANGRDAFDMQARYAEACTQIRFDGHICRAIGDTLYLNGWRPSRTGSRFVQFHRGWGPVDAQIDEALDAAKGEYACQVISAARKAGSVFRLIGIPPK